MSEEVTVHDAAKRAYGILWLEPNPSPFSIKARKELLAVLTVDEKRAGVAWAMKMKAEAAKQPTGATGRARQRGGAT